MALTIKRLTMATSQIRFLLMVPTRQTSFWKSKNSLRATTRFVSARPVTIRSVVGLTQVEDCHEVNVMPAQVNNKFQGWQISLIVAFSLGCVAFLTYAAVRIALHGKNSAGPDDLGPEKMDKTGDTSELELEESGDGVGLHRK